MSLKKAIKYGKEHRKPLRGAQTFDWSCRNHGSCAYCRDGRLVQYQKEQDRTKDQVDEWFGYWGQACEMDAWTDYIDKKYEALGLDPWKPFEQQLGTYTATYEQP